MAVKVMLATTLVKRAEEVAARSGDPAPAPDAGKPKRRRSSVYDADGSEVFITLMCLKCRKVKPLSQFGLRKMADGAIRNQPWCRPCRSGASAETPRRRRGAPREADVVAASAMVEAAAPVDASTLAAQVVAALHGGRR